MRSSEEAPCPAWCDFEGLHWHEDITDAPAGLEDAKVAISALPTCPACGMLADDHTAFQSRCRMSPATVRRLAALSAEELHGGSTPSGEECGYRDHNADINSTGVCQECGSAEKVGWQKHTQRERGDRFG